MKNLNVFLEKLIKVRLIKKVESNFKPFPGSYPSIKPVSDSIFKPVSISAQFQYQMSRLVPFVLMKSVDVSTSA